MKGLWLPLSLAIVLSATAFAQEPRFPLVQPLAGTNNVDWTIVNYVDLDSTAGFADYTGGGLHLQRTRRA